MARRNRQSVTHSAEACQGRCHAHPPFAHEVIEARPEHMAWVFKSWLESYADNAVDARRARMSRYSALMTQRMQRIVARSLVLVAVEPDDTSHLLGFVVAELVDGIPTIHFVYTKGTRREHGLAGGVVRAAFLRLAGTADPPEWHFTHATYLGKHIACRRGHGGHHNATAAWEAKGAA